ncbi:hypothetical protein NARC_90109 [Candidatus Nitrosocosmicus arcticus]|uniref:Uncharacterized protein n=1 Tax=Candidatus Nitrosocosmicus arcticus TaxID=2035267 RepID=A0A557SUC8_9ARCH|nr:hypothetical protein NARC_90109 [Candidatus Nitrosocosmicus arcticus]
MINNDITKEIRIPKQNDLKIQLINNDFEYYVEDSHKLIIKL